VIILEYAEIEQSVFLTSTTEILEFKISGLQVFFSRCGYVINAFGNAKENMKREIAHLIMLVMTQHKI
jgi:hypothetical protein